MRAIGPRTRGRSSDADPLAAATMPASPALPPAVSRTDWEDWRWQMRNRLTSAAQLDRFFPGLGPAERESFARYAARYHVALTPHVISLIETDAAGRPLEHDPIWAQFRFLDGAEPHGADGYDGRTENWEASAELPTPILQHKYPGRAILRVVGTCFGHCNYCYLTGRVLDREAARERAGGPEAWRDSLAYLRAHPDIHDVLLSGGDPLVMDDEKLDAVLHDLSSIPSIRSLRLNTRACTFNPFRLDRDLALLLRRHRVTALELHLAHPRELTPELDARLALLDEAGHRPLLLWRAPLLRGVNDSEEVLRELFVGLYARRITPYYLFHYAPFTLGRSVYGVSIRRGAALLRAIRRVVPGPAFPRFTLFHVQGKQDIPLEAEGTPEFRYDRDAEGKPEVRFLNWRGNWVSYPDVEDDA